MTNKEKTLNKLNEVIQHGLANTPQATKFCYLKVLTSETDMRLEMTDIDNIETLSDNYTLIDDKITESLHVESNVMPILIKNDNPEFSRFVTN